MIPNASSFSKIVNRACDGDTTVPLPASRISSNMNVSLRSGMSSFDTVKLQDPEPWLGSKIIFCDKPSKSPCADVFDI